jgi:hypothetical protein
VLPYFEPTAAAMFFFLRFGNEQMITLTNLFRSFFQPSKMASGFVGENETLCQLTSNHHMSLFRVAGASEAFSFLT